ncbi:MAG: helix-turn-helix domain-containing protein [Planctomycetota bacterium]
MKALGLTHPDATREKLLGMAKQVPGAWVGLKIAALLLVLEGQRPGQVNASLGLNRMTLERWIHGVNQNGVQALVPKPRPGRPSRLTPELMEQLQRDLEKPPREFGLQRGAWDGPTLVVHLKQDLGVKLKTRRAQYWLHRLGYSLKRAGYVYLQARAKDAEVFRDGLKKTGPDETP